jgi:hypothetical protein
MQIAEHIERTALVALVVPQRHPSDRNLVGRDFLLFRMWTWRNPSRSRPRIPRFSSLNWRLTTPGPNALSARLRFRSKASLLGSVQHNRNSEAVVLTRVFDQPLPILRPHIRRIHHREAPARQALGQHVVKRVESVPVAAWSFSSSLTRPRKKSDDNTSVG